MHLVPTIGYPELLLPMRELTIKGRSSIFSIPMSLSQKLIVPYTFLTNNFENGK